MHDAVQRTIIRHSKSWLIVIRLPVVKAQSRQQAPSCMLYSNRHHVFLKLIYGPLYMFEWLIGTDYWSLSDKANEIS